MISFNSPYISDLSKQYVAEAMEGEHQQGDGPFSRRAASIISSLVGGGDVLMTPSCTHALEMAAMLTGICPGDEVILPSFTFTSAATSITQFGGVPVFVDIEPNSLGINAELIENAITPKTKAISWLNYAGIAPNINLILDIADKYNLLTIEDNAHGLGATYKNRPLGGFGDFSTLSFHATKNLQCGEGGALVINNRKFIGKAQIFREKGTNRHELIMGKVQKYHWIDKGSSYLLAEILSALLTGQLEEFGALQKSRMQNWNQLLEVFSDLDLDNFTILPETDNEVSSYHMFALLFDTNEQRNKFQKVLLENNIQGTTHYEPLHSAPAGRKFGKTSGDMKNTLKISSSILRLPLWTKPMHKVLQDYSSGLKKSIKNRC